jgi:hypothetical protein
MKSLSHVGATHVSPLLLIIFFAIYPAMANTSEPSNWSKSGLGKQPFTVRQVNSQEFIIEITPPQFDVEHVGTTHVSPVLKSNGQAFQLLTIPGYGRIEEEGKPSLPMKGVLLQATPDSDVQIAIQEADSTTLVGYRIPPMRPYQGEELDTKTSAPSRPLRSAPGKLTSSYPSNAFYPRQPADIGFRGFLRDVWVVQIRIYPIQYHAARREIRFHRRLALKVTFTQSMKKAPRRSSLHEKGTVKDRLDKAQDEPTGRFIKDFENLYHMLLPNYRPYGRRMRRPYKMASAAPPLKQKSSLPPTPTYKLLVDQDGIYHINYQDLKDAHIDVLRLDPRTFALTNKGKPVPLYVAGENDGVFDPHDYLEFWGEFNRGTHSWFGEYTTTNVYWLSWGGQDERAKMNGLAHSSPFITGARMGLENGNPKQPSGTKANQSKMYRTVEHFEYDRIRAGLGYVDEERDIWFWRGINAPNCSEFSFAPHDAILSQPFRLRVMLHGWSLAKHHSLISLNGYLLDDQRWEGQREYLFQSPMMPYQGEEFVLNFGVHQIQNEELDTKSPMRPGQGKELDQKSQPLSASKMLRDGKNRLTVELLSDTTEIESSIYVNWFEVEYWREYNAVDDQLVFDSPSKEGVYQFELNGFTNQAIDIYKIGISKFTNTEMTREMNGLARSSVGSDAWVAPTHTIRFADSVVKTTGSPGQSVRYIALSSNQKKKPKAIIEDVPSELRARTNGADYIIIVYDDFYTSVLPLAEHRSAKMRTAVVKVQDIYDEFSGGLLSPEAIRDFLRYAYHYWQPPAPTYVLLVGDATWDFKNGKNYVPAYYTKTLKWGQTANDHSYACVNGDDPLADLFIGRITPRSKEAASSIVEKLLRYERQPNWGTWRHKLLMLAAERNFETDSEQLLADYVTPASAYDVRRVYTSRQSPYHGETEQLLDLWNAGCSFIHFTGHGGGGIWSDDALFTLDDVQFLMNDSMPAFVTSFTCFTGYFDDPSKNGLNEAFVNLPSGGAMAAFGSTGLGWALSDYYLEEDLFEMLFTHRIRQLGPAIAAAKVSLLADHPGSLDMIYLYNLLGDAAMSLPLPMHDIALTARLLAKDKLEIRGATHPGVNGQARLEVKGKKGAAPVSPVDVAITGGKFHTVIQNAQFITLNPEFSLNCYAWDEDSFRDASGGMFFRAARDDEIDLSIFNDDIAILPSVVSTTTRVAATIYNLGGQTAEDVTVVFYLGAPYAGGLSIGRVTLPRIDGGKSAVAEILWQPKGETATIYVHVDPLNNIVEVNETNNLAVKQLMFNAFTVTPEHGSDGLKKSVDGNFAVTIPQGAVEEPIELSIEATVLPTQYNQPDLRYAPLFSKPDGGAYNLSAKRDVAKLSDNFEVTITLRYDADHELNGRPDLLAIYQWQEERQRWMRPGPMRPSGEALSGDSVTTTTRELGLFTLMVNTDSQPPQIQLTIDDNQLPYDGTYASSTPTIYAIIEDANGVGEVQMRLNGRLIDEEELVVSYGLSPTHAKILSYTPTLEDGSYTAEVTADDFNGNTNQETITFQVGGEFALKEIANHPNPFSDETWFTYVLTQPVESVEIKIYTSAGRRIYHLKDVPARQGYNEILWDGADKNGKEVANGVYFYKIIARTQDGKRVNEIRKLAVIR